MPDSPTEEWIDSGLDLLWVKGDVPDWADVVERASVAFGVASRSRRRRPVSSARVSLVAAAVFGVCALAVAASPLRSPIVDLVLGKDAHRASYSFGSLVPDTHLAIDPASAVRLARLGVAGRSDVGQDIWGARTSDGQVCVFAVMVMGSSAVVNSTDCRVLANRTQVFDRLYELTTPDGSGPARRAWVVYGTSSAHAVTLVRRDGSSVAVRAHNGWFGVVVDDASFSGPRAPLALEFDGVREPIGERLSAHLAGR